jgi:glycosyltransferase 2 family protein
VALSQRAKNWLKFCLALGFSIFFSYLFIRGVDLDQVGEAIAAADYAYVAPALALFALSLVFRCLRWRYFLQPQQDLDWRTLLPSLLVGYAGNNLLPLRAGELLRAQHLAEHQGVARMQTFGTLLMERLFDGFILATFVLWGLLLVDAGGAYVGVGLALAGLTAAGFLVCTTIAHNPALPARVAALPLPLLNDRRREQLAGLGESFLGGFSVLQSPVRFGLASLTSAAAWGLELGMYWLISRAFDLEASFITVAFAGSAANVAMSLPSAQGGVGPFQYFATEALLEFDIARSAAAAYALALHVFLVVPVSLVGLAVLWRSTLPSARRKRRAAAPALEAPE